MEPYLRRPLPLSLALSHNNLAYLTEVIPILCRKMPIFPLAECSHGMVK